MSARSERFSIAVTHCRRVVGRQGFRFGHRVAAMTAIMSLPDRSCVPCRSSLEGLVEQASGFILKGLGMRDEAVADALVVGGKTPLETEPV